MAEAVEPTLVELPLLADATRYENVLKFLYASEHIRTHSSEPKFDNAESLKQYIIAHYKDFKFMLEGSESKVYDDANPPTADELTVAMHDALVLTGNSSYNAAIRALRDKPEMIFKSYEEYKKNKRTELDVANLEDLEQQNGENLADSTKANKKAKGKRFWSSLGLVGTALLTGAVAGGYVLGAFGLAGGFAGLASISTMPFAMLAIAGGFVLYNAGGWLVKRIWKKLKGNVKEASEIINGDADVLGSNKNVKEKMKSLRQVSNALTNALEASGKVESSWMEAVGRPYKADMEAEIIDLRDELETSLDGSARRKRDVVKDRIRRPRKVGNERTAEDVNEGAAGEEIDKTGGAVHEETGEEIDKTGGAGAAGEEPKRATARRVTREEVERRIAEELKRIETEKAGSDAEHKEEPKKAIARRVTREEFERRKAEELKRKEAEKDVNEKKPTQDVKKREDISKKGVNNKKPTPEKASNLNSRTDATEIFGQPTTGHQIGIMDTNYRANKTAYQEAGGESLLKKSSKDGELVDEESRFQELNKKSVDEMTKQERVEFATMVKARLGKIDNGTELKGLQAVYNITNAELEEYKKKHPRNSQFDYSDESLNDIGMNQ